MKKRSLFISVVLIILVLSVVLAGCSLFTTNTDRQSSRVISSVKVDLAKELGNEVKVLGNDWDYVVNIDLTRREVIASVNYMINYYQQMYSQYGYSYSYDAKTLIESSTKSLTTERYRIAMAMGELLKNANTSGRIDALYCKTSEYQAKYGKTLVPEGVLTVSEVYKARKTVAESFDESLNNYLEEEQSEEIKNAKNIANDELIKLYNEGYFVDSVSIAYKDGEEYKDGLYAEYLVAKTGDEKEVDYKNVLAKVKLTKKDAEDKFVYAPIDEEDITLAEKENAKFVAKYVTTKTITITYSGRVYAEKTDENQDGFDVAAFTSEAVEYKLVTPRSKYKEAEKEDDKLADDMRYITVANWEKPEAELTEDMKALKCDIYDLNTSSTDTKTKNAYRQLRNTVSKNSVGYIASEEDCQTDADKFNFKYYNGLIYYYNSQYNSAVLSAWEYEIGSKESVSDSDFDAEYALQFEKDKAQYTVLSSQEQIKKFFNAIEKDISSVYYVPIDALLNTKYEINPTDKKYSTLFTFDEDKNVTGFDTLVTFEDGKYYLNHAYENQNEADKYYINMFYVGQILVSFDNVDGLDKLAKSLDATGEDLLVLYEKLFKDNIQTCPQLDSYLADYDTEKTYTPEEVFEFDENGFVYYNYDEFIDAYQEAIGTPTTYDEFVETFLKLMTIWNDDSGAIDSGDSVNGYLIADGDLTTKWMEDFTATGLSIYFTQLANGGVADDASLVNATKDSYTSYGLHRMMISFAPFSNVFIGENGELEIDIKLNLAGDTRRDLLTKSILDSKKSSAYSNWTSQFTDDKVQEIATRNDANYNSLIKDLA